MKRLVVISLVFVLLAFTWSGSAWSIISLPTANFTGNSETTATTDTNPGSFTLVGAFVTQVNYLDGTSTNSNEAGVESIIGMTVTISGATRTGDYTFTDAIISISDGSFNYLTASLSNITLLLYGSQWYLNRYLDINDPSTLNLSNVVLNTDATHPSKYIDDFRTALGTNNISGMKMILLPVSPSGCSITGDCHLEITTGLIDGTPPVIEAPSGAKSVGYWKNHEEQREFFIADAVLNSTVFDTDDVLRYYLTLQGKKYMDEKAKQQLAALLLNIASSLDPATVLSSGELEILQIINPVYDETATVSDAHAEIENAILTGVLLEEAKDLADEINNRDN